LVKLLESALFKKLSNAIVSRAQLSIEIAYYRQRGGAIVRIMKILKFDASIKAFNCCRSFRIEAPLLIRKRVDWGEKQVLVIMGGSACRVKGPYRNVEIDGLPALMILGGIIFEDIFQRFGPSQQLGSQVIGRASRPMPMSIFA
jgi:hypothetical protein